MAFRGITKLFVTQTRFSQLSTLSYKRLTDNDVEILSKIVEGSIITNTDDLETYNTDWMRRCNAKSKLVLKPNSTQKVSQILSYCNQERIAVVPQGGNTGLVGGGVPMDSNEIILSLSKMNKVIEFEPSLGVLTCEAGCVLENLDRYLEKFGHCVPLDLGAKGSCQIGGNVSTNAGGLRLLRYGSLRGNVLGIEAVLADGTIIDCMSSLRKDNTGYDIKQLFIGSEGTLGVITKIALLAPIKPAYKNVAMFSCHTYEDLLQALSLAKSRLGEIVSALEFIDYEAMLVVNQHLDLKCPISLAPFFFFIETSGSNQEHDRQKLDEYLEEVYGKALVTDGTVAEDSSKAAYIWGLRERQVEAGVRVGWIYKYDLSLPLNCLYELVQETRKRCKGLASYTVSYGHLGDSNLHLNVYNTHYTQELKDTIEPFVFEWTASRGGSISAEHGMGFDKAKYIYFSKQKESVEIMRQLKRRFDPNGILNPNKTVLLDDSKCIRPPPIGKYNH
ncbi:D-2-hydroxyglutarate dehydrogenase, mitochondrial [Oopsacas minuta]|uniref:D-2-hydroxyglutarate dehydrogenase, mitochondrial n=1 Tax=Oopsacas minuta TaxID=111878 RepID=A0AAV7KLB9_9METZ|nr:D-2-hydroxyglutarate dehydrogenase, mitochondrial [Oopsacas minuta]